MFYNIGPRRQGYMKLAHCNSRLFVASKKNIFGDKRSSLFEISGKSYMAAEAFPDDDVCGLVDQQLGRKLRVLGVHGKML
jgi:hypothetical protein